MKYFILLLLTGSLAACTGTDQSASGQAGISDSLKKKAMMDTASYTRIQWIDSTYQDLGKVPKGGMVEITWRFRNTGNNPLVISEVTPGCGCTVAERPQEPVAPGKEGVIRAKYDTKNQHMGENQKNVTVVANTKEQSAHYLMFRVELTEK